MKCCRCQSFGGGRPSASLYTSFAGFWEYCERDLASLQVWNIQWGQAFRKTVHLNSMYYEPGEKSYIREAVAYQAVQ